MSGSDSSGAKLIISVHGSNTKTDAKTRILAQTEVNGKVRNYVDSLTTQVQYLTRLIQGMSTDHQRNLSPNAKTSASSAAAGPSRGNRNIAKSRQN